MQKDNKMIIRLLSILILIGMVLSGCSQSSTVNKDKHSEVKVSQSVKKEDDTYQSINDYHDIITGENIKTGILKVTKDNNVLTLEMSFKLSNKLKNIMMNTKNKFYLTFSEVDGQHELDNIIVKTPEAVEGNLSNLATTNGNYHLRQTIEIKRNATPEEIKKVTSPENYEFVFLNENKQKVAVVIGLEVSTLQP